MPAARHHHNNGFHIASELQRNSFLSLTVLADTVGGKEPEPDGFSVDRCWSFNDVNSPARLLSAIRRHEPDVVWFNLLFTTFGHNPFVAFCGLATPLLTRLSGLYTHVTLHHLMDAIDLKDQRRTGNVRHAPDGLILEDHAALIAARNASNNAAIREVLKVG